MKLTELFEIQRKLRDKIMQKHALHSRQDLAEIWVLSFRVEFAEFLNEVQFFKVWKARKGIEYKLMKEEYVDGIHFLLQIGIERKWDKFIDQIHPHAIQKYLTWDKINLANAIYDNDFRGAGKYLVAWEMYLALGEQLGIHTEDITTSYLAKNKVNHERQEVGY